MIFLQFLGMVTMSFLITYVLTPNRKKVKKNEQSVKN